ncbi:MAG: Ig-like domain-containing protein, partial [Pseudomonadota bacterium]
RVEEPGLHTIYIAARSPYFAMDQIQLVHNSVVNQSAGKAWATETFDPSLESTRIDAPAPPANQAPVAADDDVSAVWGETVTIDVIRNDRDQETRTNDLDIVSVSQPSLGTVEIVDNKVVYTPSDAPYVIDAPSPSSAVLTDSFTYTIRDEAGATSTARVSLEFSPPQPSVRMELGTETVLQVDDNGWFEVRFEQPIKDAVVVMGPVSWSHGDSTFARVTEVTDYGFKFQLEEWMYQDGVRAEPESVGWMAASQGVHTLPDGTLIQAGSTTARNEEAEDISFDAAFETVPIVFSQVSSFAGTDAVTTRNWDVTETGFSVQMQEEEARDKFHVPERLDWIAVEKSEGILDTGQTASGFKWKRTDVIDFSDTDVFLADMQTQRDAETATVRYKELADGGILVRVHEDQSQDWEQGHRFERIGYLTGEEGSYELDQFVYG